MSGALAEPVYIRDGELFVPNGVARGPWDPAAQHGGAPSALFAHELENLESDAPMQVARLTVELLRPVPMTPLKVITRVVRPGRKVQLGEAVMTAAGVEVARALALKIRRTDINVPEPPAGAPLLPAENTPFRSQLEATFIQAMEVRFAAGAFESEGPATVWFRLTRPVVDDELPSPLMRVAAAADFGNGISRIVNWETHLFINPDLTVYLHRPPEGEWGCLEAETAAARSGVGLAQSRLYDERGLIGRSLQALLFDRR
jgi:hypothetical protein